MSEFEFEIKPGTLLPPETRMELPEMSYEQELLSTPVPFENRVAYTSDYLKPHAKKEYEKDIARNLGISVVQVRRLADEVGAMKETDSQGMLKYEVHAQEIIEEELEWNRLIDELDDYISASKIGACITKHPKWVRQKLYGLGVYPQLLDDKSGLLLELYPKESIAMLRVLILHFPLANEWRSATEVGAEIGRNWDWVTRTAKKHGLDTHRRTGQMTMRVAAHYSEVTIQELRHISEMDAKVPPAGNWLTVAQLADIVGKNAGWVSSRIGNFSNHMEERLDDGLRKRPHYPPVVIEGLLLMIDTGYVFSGDWMTAHGIGAQMEASQAWIEGHLSEFNHLAEMRLYVSGNGTCKLASHYSPEVFDLLVEKYDNRAPDANGWLSLNVLAKMLGHDRKWVRRRLVPYGNIGELRQSSTGQESIHYPPWIYGALRRKDQEEKAKAQAHS